MKLTRKKALEYAREETASAKDYMKRGLPKFAADEKRHASFFRMIAKNKKKK